MSDVKNFNFENFKEACKDIDGEVTGGDFITACKIDNGLIYASNLGGIAVGLTNDSENTKYSARVENPTDLKSFEDKGAIIVWDNEGNKVELFK